MKIAATGIKKERVVEGQDHVKSMTLVPRPTRTRASFRIEISDDMFRPRRNGEPAGRTDIANLSYVADSQNRPAERVDAGKLKGSVALAAVSGMVIGFLIARYWRQ